MGEGETPPKTYSVDVEGSYTVECPERAQGAGPGDAGGEDQEWDERENVCGGSRGKCRLVLSAPPRRIKVVGPVRVRVEPERGPEGKEAEVETQIAEAEVGMVV